MSFTENPFKHVTFGVVDESHVQLECSSCGGTNGPYPKDMTAGELLEKQEFHVKLSHKRTPEDFRGWT